jgi:hypothetical protein
VSRLEHYTSKCPNKNIIILRDGEVESAGDESRCKSMSNLKILVMLNIMLMVNSWL